MKQILTPLPFREVHDVVFGLTRLKNSLIASEDRRGVFATAYLEITLTLQRWIRQRRFQDNESASDYLVSFANLYRQAFVDFEQGRRQEVPDCWALSFKASCTRDFSLSQDLLLGINAHINHDLPFAVLNANLDLQCKSHYRDHILINDALRVATSKVRNKIVSIFQPNMRIQSFLLGRSIDSLTARAFCVARKNAWDAAVALDSAVIPTDREYISRQIRNRATETGQRMLSASRSPFLCLQIVQQVDSLIPAQTRQASSGAKAPHFLGRHSV